MRFAYDLRFASDHFVGIATYAFCLLDSLARGPGDERWLVLWDSRQRPTRFDFASLRSSPRLEWCELRDWPLSPMSPWRTGAALRRLRPDAFFSPYHLVPLAPRCPCVVTLHDTRPLRAQGDRSLSRLIYRWSVARAKRAAALVTVSDFSRGEIEALAPSVRGRVKTVQPGVHRSLRALEPVRPARTPEAPFALVVGDNRPHKNLALLIETWRRLGAESPIALVSAGPVDERTPSIEALAAAAGVRNVTGLGRVTEPELTWLYRNATLLLFPSRYEGFGSPLAEALDHGLPALCSKIDALRETAGDAAEYLPADDADAWADAVRRLLADAPARAAMSARGRARAAELSYDASAEVLRALMRDVAAKR